MPSFLLILEKAQVDLNGLYTVKEMVVHLRNGRFEKVLLGILNNWHL